VGKINYDISWIDRYKVYVGKSDIHGVGLRAIKDIKRHETVFYYRSKDTYPISKNVLIQNGIDKRVVNTLSRLYFCNHETLYLQQDQQLHFVNFLNHSKNCNMYFSQGYYIAKEDIKQDEEVTLNFLANGYHPQLSFTPNKI
tara:strand:- start:14426 stop:14851 length:426 start_codon:yes stop_codon:yes gene_type:complete